MASIRSALLLTGLLGLTACATASKMTIADRLQELGLSEDRAECMADELDDRLDDRELSEFADFTVTITKERGTGVLAALREIDNPRIAGAVAGSGVACVLPR